MEAIEELPAVHSVSEVVKDAAVSGDPSPEYVESSTCHKTNGVADVTTLLESADADYPGGAAVPETLQSVHSMLQGGMFVEPSASDASATADTGGPLPAEAELLAAMETTAAVQHLLSDGKTSEEETIETTFVSEPVVCEQAATSDPEHAATVLEEVSTYEIVGDKVTFTTEIVVEKNDIETTETVIESYDHTNTILNELGQGMELSEALRSADNVDSVENNNCSGGEEVFNKEELLDILEGNDDDAGTQHSLNSSDNNTALQRHKELALNQLSRLKRPKKVKKSPPPKKSTIIRHKRKNSKESSNNKVAEIDPSANDKTNLDDSNVSAESSKEVKKGNENIVKKLVKDWDDDEPAESGQMFELSADSIKAEEVETTQESVISQEEAMAKTPMETTNVTETTTTAVKETSDEAHPQKRLSRVIKKKIPFDPDNPPTFTKKTTKKDSKTSLQNEKEQTPEKKNKVDQEQIQRSKSKSPMSKMQWKKPPPKNGNSNKQFGKRPTEVDKLLMDEGAVNMIYQLTPEAPKGRKNMRTKAEFIKKVQSSAPDGKEMKFRERKKEAKLEEGEPRKIAGGKQRSSMSSSVKSPAAVDDFETHSADDSIIYRRHSSSSYSSPCMSPRRLSDVDPAAVQAAARASRQASAARDPPAETADQTNTFMNDTATEVINKDDCLSIKDKLNKKISQALNKRKRESTKTEKPSKQKKLAKDADVVKVEKIDTFKYVSVTFDQRLAEICILKTGLNAGVLVYKELEQALQKVENMKDITVTLLTSETGELCSEVDMRPLLDNNIEKRMNYAYEVAESIRRVLSCAASHSKLLVSGAWGACGSVALALLVLSDSALAADSASFGARAGLPAPGLAVLTAGPRPVSPASVSEVVVFGRRLSTAEAASSGLVSQVWPGDAAAMRHAAAVLSRLSPQSVMLKKQVLGLRKTREAMATFQSSLEKERDMLVEYWTSVEGQETIRTSLNVE